MTTLAQPCTDVKVRLINEDGNAFHILGKVSKALKDAGYDEEFIRQFQSEAMSSDYDNLLMTVMCYVKVL